MENLKAKLIKIRRTIHKYPELGFKEKKTSRLVAGILRDYGIKVKTGVGGTGVIGLIEGKKRSSGKKRCIALRADMDALPIQEKTRKPYRSCINGIMHACGHDGNTTIVLGAAMLLSKRRDSFSGKVKLIFQPSEETGNGARRMIEAGVLRNPNVDAIMGVHVHPGIPKGKIGIKYGEMMAAVDKFKITILSKGGHGANPHQGVDGILVASAVIQSLQHIVSRQIAPTDPCVISVGQINGGVEFNVLAEEVVMIGTVRTVTKSLRQRIPGLIERVIRGICRTYKADYRLDYERVGNPLINTFSTTDFIYNEALGYFGKKNIVSIKKPTMGGEDFADYLARVPGSFIYIGAGNKSKGILEQWHSSRFDIDEDALPIGAEFIYNCILNYI